MDRVGGAERAWQDQIDEAIDGRDRVLCNLRITLVHQELSLALRRTIGSDSGPNFHTWAVWGSKTAGRTIRQEELPVSARARLVGTSFGVGGAALITRRRPSPRRTASLGGAAALGVGTSWALSRLTGRASSQIFSGNATVLDDIGRESARFIELAPDDDDAFEEFLGSLRPGAPEVGGQDLLRGAYRHYREASSATDPDHRDELMLYANLLAILHEHHRLEPYIAASVPAPLHRFVTDRMLRFSIGQEAMRVGENVVPGPDSAAFPATLATIEDPELASLLSGPGGLDRTPNSLSGSAAHDWTKLADRMNYIVDLFRSHQSDPELFRAPYTDAQRGAILAGWVPDGPL